MATAGLLGGHRTAGEWIIKLTYCCLLEVKKEERNGINETMQLPITTHRTRHFVFLFVKNLFNRNRYFFRCTSHERRYQLNF